MIRVALRGVGLLGSRIVSAARRSTDIRVVAGIGKFDPTLERLMEDVRISGDKTGIPDSMYLLDEESCQKARELLGSDVDFHPVEELDLSAFDLVIDTAPANDRWAKLDQFAGTVLLQDGAYPAGDLILPPLRENGRGARPRVGGCILSGIVPVIAQFREKLTAVRVFVVMQNDKRESDYLIAERVNSFAIEPSHIDRLNRELSGLLPNVQIDFVQVLQIPGRLHYAVTLDLEFKNPISRPGVLNLLALVPHSQILSSSILSTYGLNRVESMGKALPPISIFERSLQVEGNKTRVTLALSYRMITVASNLDAIRTLAGGLSIEEAPGKTDAEMGWKR